MAKKLVGTDRLMIPIAHFSLGQRVGDVIHLGATAGTDPDRRLAGSTPGITDIRAQTDLMYRFGYVSKFIDFGAGKVDDGPSI